jgi:hypothetical protein
VDIQARTYVKHTLQKLSNMTSVGDIWMTRECGEGKKFQQVYDDKKRQNGKVKRGIEWR